MRLRTGVRAPASPAQRILGEVSEGAVEAPSDRMEQVRRVVTISP
jgi:hypothetical protein